MGSEMCIRDRHNAFCEREADSIASARRRMEHARAEEFARWAASGELSA